MQINAQPVMVDIPVTPSVSMGFGTLSYDDSNVSTIAAPQAQIFRKVFIGIWLKSKVLTASDNFGVFMATAKISKSKLFYEWLETNKVGPILKPFLRHPKDIYVEIH